MEILKSTLYVLFALNAILLIGIVLLQEGKGGGLGNAFGGAGGEAFGHGVGGINRFTSYAAGSLMVISLVLAIMNSSPAL